MKIFIVLAFTSMVALGAPQGPANIYGLPSTGKTEFAVPIAPAKSSPILTVPFAPAPVPSIAIPLPVSSIPLAPAAPLPSPAVLVPGEVVSPVALAPSPSSFPTSNVVGQSLSPEEIVLPQNSRLSIQDQRGQYSHGFSNNEGTQVSEQGRLITTNGGWEYVIAKKGSYSYISPEGKKITVNYIADENGFRVLGELVS